MDQPYQTPYQDQRHQNQNNKSTLIYKFMSTLVIMGVTPAVAYLLWRTYTNSPNKDMGEFIKVSIEFIKANGILASDNKVIDSEGAQTQGINENFKVAMNAFATMDKSNKSDDKPIMPGPYGFNSPLNVTRSHATDRVSGYNKPNQIGQGGDEQNGEETEAHMTSNDKIIDSIKISDDCARSYGKLALQIGVMLEAIFPVDKTIKRVFGNVPKVPIIITRYVTKEVQADIAKENTDPSLPQLISLPVLISTFEAARKCSPDALLSHIDDLEKHVIDPIQLFDSDRYKAQETYAQTFSRYAFCRRVEKLFGEILGLLVDSSSIRNSYNAWVVNRAINPIIEDALYSIPECKNLIRDLYIDIIKPVLDNADGSNRQAIPHYNVTKPIISYQYPAILNMFIGLYGNPKDINGKDEYSIRYLSEDSNVTLLAFLDQSVVKLEEFRVTINRYLPPSNTTRQIKVGSTYSAIAAGILEINQLIDQVIDEIEDFEITATANINDTRRRRTIAEKTKTVTDRNMYQFFNDSYSYKTRDRNPARDGNQQLFIFATTDKRS